eukprot:7692456-Alexandrium_andersonii.AAC.1
MQTLSAWQVGLGVFSFANTGLRDAFNEMWHLMFRCTNPGCNQKNSTRLVFSACQKPLPVLGEMSEFLLKW